jgi:hypothetical protein
MMQLTQFRNKVKTHGLALALLYSAKYAIDPFWRKYWLAGIRKSYSQSCEDVVIDRILGNKKTAIISTSAHSTRTN